MHPSARPMASCSNEIVKTYSIAPAYKNLFFKSLAYLLRRVFLGLVQPFNALGFPLKNFLTVCFALPDCSTFMVILLKGKGIHLKICIQLTVYYLRVPSCTIRLTLVVVWLSRSHFLVIPLRDFLPRYVFLYFLSTNKVPSLPAVSFPQCVKNESYYSAIVMRPRVTEKCV